jgi:hypothetical protein
MAEGWRTWFGFLAGKESVQIGSGSYLASYVVGVEDSFPGVKAVRIWRICLEEQGKQRIISVRTVRVPALLENSSETGHLKSSSPILWITPWRNKSINFSHFAAGMSWTEFRFAVTLMQMECYCGMHASNYLPETNSDWHADVKLKMSGLWM